MKKITSLSIITGITLTVVTMAFAQSATTTAATSAPSYAESLKAARATLKADVDQLAQDRAVYNKAVKAKDTTSAATAKAKIADDKAKIKADTKAIEDMKKAHAKTLIKKEVKKIEKKDKGMGTTTPSTN